MKSETIISEQFYTAANTAVINEPALKGSFFGTKEKSPKIHVDRPKSPFGLAVLIGTFILMLIGGYSVFVLQDDFEQFQLERMQSTLGFPFLIIATILFFYQTGVFLYSSYLYFRYKAIPSVSDELLPTVTIIVPAYNEGKLVWNTLLSLAESDYPAHKMQILGVDDGSKDDTWYWMQEAKAKLGDRLDIFQQPKNQGKRHALYRGFQLGTGEIFVTVDSDSIVRKDTLRNLVSPFVVNEKCGAVAGNVQVLNNKKAILPKMLNVSFVMSFEFQRSVESQLGSVLCTPGALAAYRKDAVLNCLPEWINQTFMGQPSDIGEDRAMTNMILKQGLHVLFQRNAVVLTNVPEEYKGLYKMFIRWSRSNVRENLAMGKFVFKNFREGSKFGARMLFLNQFFKIAMTYPFLIFLIYFVAVHPILFLSSTFLGILILSTFTMVFYAKRYDVAESFWAYTYSIFYTFSLFWIAPYAIVTANKRGWLTRGL